jgi:hypothetical protein
MSLDFSKLYLYLYFLKYIFTVFLKIHVHLYLCLSTSIFTSFSQRLFFSLFLTVFYLYFSKYIFFSFLNIPRKTPFLYQNLYIFFFKHLSTSVAHFSLFSVYQHASIPFCNFLEITFLSFSQHLSSCCYHIV